MIAGIITVEERLINALALKTKLSEFCDEVIVYVDTDKRGVEWNTLRMIEDISSKSEYDAPMLFFTDDAILSKNFQFNLNHVLLNDSENTTVFSLFSNNRSDWDWTEIPDGLHKVTKYPQLFGDQGWLMYNRIDSIVDKIKTYIDNSPFDEVVEHIDIALGFFFVDTLGFYKIPVPHIVEHDLSLESTLNHGNEKLGKSRFIDDYSKRAFSILYSNLPRVKINDN